MLVKEKLRDATPRHMAPEELLTMQAYYLCSFEPIYKMITFPLPVPKYSKDSVFPDCSVPVFAWEREGSSYISYLAELPAELQGKPLEEKLSVLNTQLCFAGRFFVAENALTYFYLSQAIFCPNGEGVDGKRGDPFELAAARAARNQVDHAILHSLAAVIGNMARAIDMVAEVCLPISYYTNLDFSDIEF